MLCQFLVHETPLLNKLNKTVAENRLKLSLLCVHVESSHPQWNRQRGSLGAACMCSYVLSFLRFGWMCCYTQLAGSTLLENVADTANTALILKRHNLCSRSGCYIRNTHHHPHREDFSLCMFSFFVLLRRRREGRYSIWTALLSRYIYSSCVLTYLTDIH